MSFASRCQCHGTISLKPSAPQLPQQLIEYVSYEFKDLALCLLHCKHSINVNFFFSNSSSIPLHTTFLPFIPLLFSILFFSHLRHVCVSFPQLDCQVIFSIVSSTEQKLIHVCFCPLCLITLCTVDLMNWRRKDSSNLYCLLLQIPHFPLCFHFLSSLYGTSKLF